MAMASQRMGTPLGEVGRRRFILGERHLDSRTSGADTGYGDNRMNTVNHNIMSDTTKDAVRKTNSLFPSAQNRFFYTDPSGDGSRFFSTETERDAAMKEAIAAWCDEGWSEEVDQIFSGVVTHTVEKCDVQTKPQPCAAHPDHDYGDNDCEACIAWDEFPNHEFDEVCNYKPVALLVPAQVQAEKDAKTAELHKMLANIMHDQTTAMQSALIEWKHGKGAEAGLQWIVNTLMGPGLLPDFDAEHGTNAQFWFDANQSQPMPKCFCGNPSHIGWMGQGFCCNEHYAEAKAKHDAAPASSAGDQEVGS